MNNKPDSKKNNIHIWMCLAFLGFSTILPALETGVTKNSIRIASVLDLNGRSKGLGQGMKAGIQAAIAGQTIQGKSIEYITANDSYTPTKTIEETQNMVDRGVFAMIGNVGTPTAKVSLPILAKNQVPAIGFFTGAGLLRPGVGDINNYRASYVQETAAVISSALDSGIKPDEICAFVQNDAYGMAGVTGIKRALAGVNQLSSSTKEALNKIIGMTGENPNRNGIGPIGVYQRNTNISSPGYKSLKAWEKAQSVQCKLVVTVGAYTAIAKFIEYSRYKGENWLVSAVSFTGAGNLSRALASANIYDGVIMTQVVPPLDSKLEIVQAAKAALGNKFGYVSLEGYIVGKMWLKAMKNIKGDITRKNYLKSINSQQYSLGGVEINFTDDNQGSDLVIMTNLGSDDGFKPIQSQELSNLFNKKIGE